MQTFVPVPWFEDSAAMLDRARLGKQRVETLQLLKALAGETKGWVNHPAAKMWRGYENALVQYGLAMCDEWIKRGYADTCRDKIAAYAYDAPIVMPVWWGRADVHASHRSNLLRKDPAFYGRYNWNEPADMQYVWPEGGK
jgi:Pyrimidine dimer DNA glycosylase